MEKIKVASLFCGCGGMDLGVLGGFSYLGKEYKKNPFEIVYSVDNDNYCTQIYNANFEHKCVVKDVRDIDINEIPDFDMLIGGFPCQDYSVARSKKNEQGIEGKKGVLFWEIIRATRIIKPKYLILENVDRLLKAPSKQRGRDFAIMLTAFNNLGYSVEWRVINAADYGRSQRRRRVFFFVFRNDTKYAKSLDSKYENEDIVFEEHKYDDYLFQTGLFATQFPIKQAPVKNRQVFYELEDDIVAVSDNFTGTVWNTGVMRHGKYYSIETVANFDGNPITLGEILQDETEVPDKYFLTDKAKLEKFQYLRGPKKLERTSADGHTYIYSEGGMSPYDDLNLPGRTMLTSEGTVNRSTHFLFVNNKYRLLTPIEAERLQDFPDDWTAYKKLEDGTVVEVSDKMRMFFMGNALVTEIVRKIGDFIKTID